ncbi:MAG: flagellar biosynthetic protein FliO [Steroidobacteraceae bacterium]|nr:flagellar biosynthetic protein FliO [Steroidobacteraceae bacterium]
MMPLSHSPAPLSAGGIVQVSLSLALIVALIFAISWVLKRLRFSPRIGRGQIGVIDECAIGPRERIVLVRVGEAQLLLGLSAGGIVGLTPLATPIPSASAASEPGFALRLRELLGRGGGSPG